LHLIVQFFFLSFTNREAKNKNKEEKKEIRKEVAAGSVGEFKVARIDVSINLYTHTHTELS